MPQRTLTASARLAVVLLLAGCSGSDCVSGPLCDGNGNSGGSQTVMGTVSGTVTVGGTGLANVSVRLSNGSTTTTGATGNYSFSSVPAGSYTVTISNMTSDVTCGTTNLSVTISTSARQATAHFTCQPADNARISGTVSAEGFGVPNVQVALSGTSSPATTDANGHFSFTSLRAGEYTVTISGFNEILYSFTTTSHSVTLSAGQAATVDFEGLTCLVGSISMNQTREGTLADDNCTIASGEYVDAWSLSLASSTAVKIDLVSTDFDAFLVLTDDMIVTIDEDDDGGSGVNSQINITLDAGDYVIWATSFSAGQTGAYELSLREPGASVTISSITVPGTGGVAVDPAAVVGPIDVNLTIDEGTETVTRVDVLLDGVVVGTESLSTTAPSENGPAATVRSATIQINTAAFLDGMHVLSAEITITGGAGGTRTVAADQSVSLTFANSAVSTCESADGVAVAFCRQVNNYEAGFGVPGQDFITVDCIVGPAGATVSNTRNGTYSCGGTYRLTSFSTASIALNWGGSTTYSLYETFEILSPGEGSFSVRVNKISGGNGNLFLTMSSGYSWMFDAVPVNTVCAAGVIPEVKPTTSGFARLQKEGSFLTKTVTRTYGL